MKVINVGREFSTRLANRNSKQGDGSYTAEEFRSRFLSSLDSPEAWKHTGEEIDLDFSDVEVIGPSFANEAFAYFTKYANPEKILEKIKFVNLSGLKKAIILEELTSSYKR